MNEEDQNVARNQTMYVYLYIIKYLEVFVWGVAFALHNHILYITAVSEFLKTFISYVLFQCHFLFLYNNATAIYQKIYMQNITWSLLVFN